MAKAEVINFLQQLAKESKLRHKLKILSKYEVLTNAQQLGYKFTEQEFDNTVWDLEISLAKKLGENFDLNFSLWEAMWGNYYLEFIATNVFDCFSAAEIEEFTKQ
jgi:Nif11 domain